jgi:hypothetical protein
MSTSTNTNTVSKVHTFAGQELNSAVKGIIWNILDERPHKAYLTRTHEAANVRRHLLQILAIAAGIHQQAIAITNIATNTYVAAVSLNNPMKTFNVKAFVLIYFESDTGTIPNYDLFLFLSFSFFLYLFRLYPSFVPFHHF